MDEPRAPLTVFLVQFIFQIAKVNLPSEADEPIAGPEGFFSSAAFEDEELELEEVVVELPEPPAAPITPSKMKITTTFCHVFNERNFSHTFFKNPIFTPSVAVMPRIVRVLFCNA